MEFAQDILALCILLGDEGPRLHCTVMVRTKNRQAALGINTKDVVPWRAAIGVTCVANLPSVLMGRRILGSFQAPFAWCYKQSRILAEYKSL